MPTPLPHVKIELDFTVLLEVGLSKGVFSGEGEARMGDFADGPDLPDRLQWSKALHIHCTLPSSEITSEYFCKHIACVRQRALLLLLRLLLNKHS